MFTVKSLKPRRKQRFGSSVETVGDKPVWQLLAESTKAKDDRCDTLIKAGAFTIDDFAKHLGWSRHKAKWQIAKLGLKYEAAHDKRKRGCAMTKFFFPPGVKLPPQ